jgi:glucose-6-phosphate isomerase
MNHFDLYKLNLDGLLNDSCLKDFPSQNHNRSSAQKLLDLWTTDSKNSIYSGYRKSVLNSEGLSESKELAKKLREQFSTLVVFGIGGSALGAMAVVRALETLIPKSQRKRVEFCDNLDPLYFEDLWNSLDVENTVFAFVSKSGGTVETASQMAFVLERLRILKIQKPNQIIAITDPTKGSLRKWVENRATLSLPVPPTVGGRFSVFSPVGLLPIAFCGIDIDEFTQGAKDHFESDSIEKNKLYSLAERLVDCEISGVRAHSFWPYSTVLRFVSSWFVQLWGESLGKVNQKNVPVGILPIPGIGATDQHSFLQMLAQGRKNVVSGFLKINDWPHIGQFSNLVPKMDSEFQEISYLTGRTMGEILNSELVATEQSLRENFRPTYCVELKTLNAKCLGALLALMMDLTTYTATLMDINPFDQPGVERGKVILKDLLKP